MVEQHLLLLKSATTLSILTFNIMAFRITTLSIMGLLATQSIIDT
jgi:hypothetical protein